MFQCFYLIANKICHKISPKWNGIDLILIRLNDKTIPLDEISAIVVQSIQSIQFWVSCFSFGHLRRFVLLFLFRFCFVYFFCSRIPISVKVWWSVWIGFRSSMRAPFAPDQFGHHFGQFINPFGASFDVDARN